MYRTFSGGYSFAGGTALLDCIVLTMEEMMEYEYQSHLKKQLQQQQPPLVPDRRRVIKKPGTIHDAAQAGDLVALQVKLQENGSLINLRNPVVRVLHSQDAIFIFRSGKLPGPDAHLHARVR